MNIFVPIGPLAIPLNVLLTLIAVCLALWITARDAKRAGIKTEAQVWLVLAVGLVAARLGFVLSYADAYLAEPMSLLDVRDGGWNPWWGLAGIWATTLLLAYRRPAGAKPVIKGMSTLSLGVLLVVALAALPTDANRPLPALPVTALDGEAASLPSFTGKPTVINLWASWCGPCRREMPMLQQAQEQHPQVNFVFLNQGEDAATVELFLQGDRLELNVDTREFIKLNISLVAGDVLTVSTGYGEKAVKLNRGGTITDAFRYLDVDSSYLQIAVGDNLFRYSADANAENLEVSIYHNNLYLGV